MAPRRLVRRLGRKLSRSNHSSCSPSASSDTEDAPLGSQKDPIHVLTRDTPVGWAVIQKALDDFDKEQIEGVKNDIDTLLVFIGLFSAVLTAFLAIAVALLQEDVPGATLTTLRQMSVQNANYTIQGHFIHSTSPAPTSSPPFEPTANAIVINDLWTASLVIGLATASLGILVKQWLREYMKFVTSFPQGRLRIRKFRREGLETWKVLTIAAFLPLLLQLALGLFFIGLCFYTTELHSSVRNTTLPLVSGWGLIFFFVTISPLFSAHCPYKTPALDSLVVAVRPHIRAGIRTLWSTPLKALKKFAHYIYMKTPRYSTAEKIAEMVDDWADRYTSRLKDPDGPPHSEAAAAKYESGDLIIMVDADALQGNDEIVGTAMVDALQQITAPPQDVVGFVLQILQHRVPWEGDSHSEPQIINCSTATTRALDSIHAVLQQHLPINAVLVPSNGNFELGPMISWTAALHLSLWIYRGFDRVDPPTWEPLNKRPEVFAEVAVAVPSAQGLKSLLHLTHRLCRELQLDLTQSLAQIKSIVEPFFRKLVLTDSIGSEDYNAPWRSVLSEISLRDTVVFLISLLRDEDGEWSDVHHTAISLIIKLIAVRPFAFDDSIAAVRRMTLSSKSDAAVQKLLTQLIKLYPDLFSLYVSHKDFSTDINALSCLRATIEAITRDSPVQLTRLSALKACRSLAESIFDIRDNLKSMALTESWRGVFAVLARLILLAPVLEGRAREEATQIELCFEWHSAVDAPTEGGDRDEEEKYLGWLAAFKPEESPIPDGLYLTLAHIFIPETRHWRVRRLQEMTLQEREAAAKDIDPFLRKSGADNIYNSIASPSTEGGTGGADAPGGGDGHDDSPSNFATGTQGLERHAVAALSLELGDTGASADPEYTDEQGEATAEDITRRNLEAADLRLRDADPQQNVPSDAETVADNADVQVTLRHGGQRLG